MINSLFTCVKMKIVQIDAVEILNKSVARAALQCVLISFISYNTTVHAAALIIFICMLIHVRSRMHAFEIE